MPTLRASLALITLCVVGACSDGKLRETSEADANGEEERDAQVPSAEHDAEASDAALDAAASERDGEATGVMDATPAADAAGSEDGAAPDAGAPCSVEAGVDSSCVAHLCEVDGGTALALEQDDPWRIGALDWTATVCGRSLGWPAAATSDARQLVYSLMAADVQQVQHGAPVQVYYGGPGSAPGMAVQDCTLALHSPVSACRAAP